MTGSAPFACEIDGSHRSSMMANAVMDSGGLGTVFSGKSDLLSGCNRFHRRFIVPAPALPGKRIAWPLIIFLEKLKAGPDQ